MTKPKGKSLRWKMTISSGYDKIDVENDGATLNQNNFFKNQNKFINLQR